MTNPHIECANAIRVLAVDAVQKARSGHPGMPMGMADCAAVLWREILRVNPVNPAWINRDRFVLSNGHGAMLQYAVLHLSGFPVSISDLQQFRQLHSATPGHPEYGHTPGVETTTGPLGQGLANAVGMAIAQQQVAARYHRDDHRVLDHHTYAFVGDGCLMEGISHEVCSLAGTLGLGRLIVLWDNNGISIDGQIAPWFSEDVAARFKAYGWQVLEAVDGHDPKQIAEAFQAAKADDQKPTLIDCRTHIGFGSPNKVDTASVHGSPLGDDEIALMRETLGWEHPPFVIPQSVYDAFSLVDKGAQAQADWQTQWDAYARAYPELAKECLRCMQGDLPSNWISIVQNSLTAMREIDKPMATRQSSQRCLSVLQKSLPELVGGSADLSGSNGTKNAESIAFSKENQSGNYLHYGVREFGMAAIMNGMALHGGIIPYGGTFLVFVDYMRNAVRLSALMKQRVIYVLTHDSIALGEDGPTHQPIEHANMLRATPGLYVWRPADALETGIAWTQAMAHQGPSALLLTRQALPDLHLTDKQVAQAACGAYVLSDAVNAKAVIIATGSEVSLALEARNALSELGIPVRVVSMPCEEAFLEQSQAYRDEILPSSLSIRVAVEAGATASWYRWVGLQGDVVGIDRFGVSAPANEAYAYLGVTKEVIVERVKLLINN